MKIITIYIVVSMTPIYPYNGYSIGHCYNGCSKKSSRPNYYGWKESYGAGVA